MFAAAQQMPVSQGRLARLVPEGRPARALAFGRTFLTESRERDVSLLAAAVAYYGFVSMIPLALLAVVVGSMLAGEEIARFAQRTTGELLTPSGQELLGTALEADAGRGGATVAGFVVLLWGTLRLFRSVDRAFSLIYGSTAGSLPKQLRDAVAVLVAITVGLMALVVVGTAIARLPVPSVQGAGLAGLWMTLLVVFLPLYVLFPGVGVGFREALPGAAFAATGFTALGTAFGFYTTVAGNYALYGFLGVVLLFVTWLYFASLAVLMGALLNAVLAGRVGDWRSEE